MSLKLHLFRGGLPLAAAGAVLGAHPYDRDGNKRTNKDRASTLAKNALVLGLAGTAWSAGSKPLLNRLSKKPAPPRPMERAQLLELHPDPQIKTATLSWRNLKADLIGLGLPFALLGGVLGLLPSHKREGNTWKKKSLGDRLKTSVRGMLIGGLLGTALLTGARGLNHVGDLVDPPRPRSFSFSSPTITFEPRTPPAPPPGGFGRLSNIDPPTPGPVARGRHGLPLTGSSSSSLGSVLQPRQLTAIENAVLDIGDSVSSIRNPYASSARRVTDPVPSPLAVSSVAPVVPEVDPSILRFSNLDLEGGPTHPNHGKSKKAALNPSCVDAFVDEIQKIANTGAMIGAASGAYLMPGGPKAKVVGGLRGAGLGGATHLVGSAATGAFVDEQQQRQHAALQGQ